MVVSGAVPSVKIQQKKGDLFHLTLRFDMLSEMLDCQ